MMYMDPSKAAAFAAANPNIVPLTGGGIDVGENVNETLNLTPPSQFAPMPPYSGNTNSGAFNANPFFNTVRSQTPTMRQFSNPYGGFGGFGGGYGSPYGSPYGGGFGFGSPYGGGFGIPYGGGFGGGFGSPFGGFGGGSPFLMGGFGSPFGGGFGSPYGGGFGSPFPGAMY